MSSWLFRHRPSNACHVQHKFRSIVGVLKTHAMEEDDSPLSSMDDTMFDLYSEKLEDFCDDSQQPLLESQTSRKPPFPQEKYGYKQFLRIRIVLLPLLVAFIALAAWTNRKLPHCKFFVICRTQCLSLTPLPSCKVLRIQDYIPEGNGDNLPATSSTPTSMQSGV